MQVDPQKVITHLSNEVSRLTTELAVARAAIEQLAESKSTLAPEGVDYAEGDDNF
jgi:hypothetical protein